MEYGVVKFGHLVRWVPDLDVAVRNYQALGFTVQRGGQHPRITPHGVLIRGTSS